MWTLFKKELLELSRDRKTLFFLIAMPTLIIPLLMLLAGGVAGAVAHQTMSKPLRIAVVGEDPDYQITQLINAQSRLQRVSLPAGLEPLQAITEEKLELILRIEADELGHMVWSLLFNGDETRQRAETALQAMAEEYKQGLLQQALRGLGVDEAKQQHWLDPLQLDYQDVADERENLGAKLGGLLPYLVLITALTGAMYPALDIGVGEKERGSLETLMVAPLTVAGMVMAKMAVIFATSVASALLTILSILLWGGAGLLLLNSEAILTMLEPLMSGDLLLMVVLILPVSLLYAACMMAVSFYAKSMKEAQNYLGYVTFIPIIPVMLASIPGLELNWRWALVPLANIALAMKELAKGTLGWELYLFVWAYSIALVVLITRACINWCKREQVLFR